MEFFLSWSVVSVYAAITVAWFVCCPPIRQDPKYHAFADQRPCCALPHAANVWSNLPFLLIGLYGLTECSPAAWDTPPFMFYIGSILTAFGSAYYHWQPNHQTLVFDRLPMTLCTNAAFLYILEPVVSSPAFAAILYLSGLASVWYWKVYDDLRYYAWVQYFPLLLLPILPSFPHLWTAVFWYILARMVEFMDRWVYNVTRQALSGHTLKHLFAAWSMYHLHLMFWST